MMPGMSGHEFCCLLRETVPSTVLPIIMVGAGWMGGGRGGRSGGGKRW